MSQKFFKFGHLFSFRVLLKKELFKTLVTYTFGKVLPVRFISNQLIFHCSKARVVHVQPMFALWVEYVWSVMAQQCVSVQHAVPNWTQCVAMMAFLTTMSAYSVQRPVIHTAVLPSDTGEHAVSIILYIYIQFSFK